MPRETYRNAPDRAAEATAVLTRDAPAGASLGLRSVRERRARAGSIADRRRKLSIGLVNNMPDAALTATERQFARVLDAASAEIDIVLRLYDLTEVARAPATRASMRRAYFGVDHLRLAPPDALIVTGAEPRAPRLALEPYWGALTGLIDWASGRTQSILLSCLAAHAGVLHLDGIEREPMAAKLSGVFGLDVVRAHPLVSGLERGYQAPHSRLNGLSESALKRAGYTILTRSAEAGVDIFIRECDTLMAFVQGHPEYEGDSLAREYRRDIGRFLRGERASAPALPRHYYSAAAAAALESFAARASASPSPDLAADFPAVDPLVSREPPWRASGIRLYKNWLGLIADRKAARSDPFAFAARRWGG